MAPGYSVVRIVDGQEFKASEIGRIHFDSDGRGTGDRSGFARVLTHETAADVAAVFRKRDGYGASLDDLRKRDTAKSG